MNANYERETRKLRDNGRILVSGLRRNVRLVMRMRVDENVGITLPLG